MDRLEPDGGKGSVGAALILTGRKLMRPTEPVKSHIKPYYRVLFFQYYAPYFIWSFFPFSLLFAELFK